MERVRSWVAPTDSIGAAFADSLQVPRSPASQVRWVSDAALCARALDAYRRTSGRPAGVSHRVYLIEAGSVYVVLDPDYSFQPGPPQLYTTAIFDRSWRLLAHLAG